jgi:preprotein translocase subunit SecA
MRQLNPKNKETLDHIKLVENKAREFFDCVKQKRPSTDEDVTHLLKAFQALKETSPFVKELKVLQVASVLMSITKSNKKGMLQEIKTGEGKSIIGRLTCACFFLKGQKVTIIFSAENLAKREYNESLAFFKKLEITSELCFEFRNRSTEEKNKNNIYLKADVLLSTLKELCFDEISDMQNNNVYEPTPEDAEKVEFASFKGKYFRKCRENDILIVDEVDNMLIDQKTQTSQLTAPDS